MEFKNGIGVQAIQDVMVKIPRHRRHTQQVRHRLRHLQGRDLSSEGCRFHPWSQ